MTSHFDPPEPAPDRLYRDIDAIFAHNGLIQPATGRRRIMIAASLIVAVMVGVLVPGRISIDDHRRHYAPAPDIVHNARPAQASRAQATPTPPAIFEEDLSTRESSQQRRSAPVRKVREPFTRSWHASTRDMSPRIMVATARPQKARSATLPLDLADGASNPASSELPVKSHAVDRPRIAAADPAPASVVDEDADLHRVESAFRTTAAASSSRRSSAIDAIQALRRQ